jgi:hypothetical protein
MPSIPWSRVPEIPHLAGEVGGALPSCYCAGLIFSPARRRFGGCVRVGPQWILTAHHVLDIPDLAADFRCRFGYVNPRQQDFVDYDLDAGGFFASDDGIQGPSGWGFELDYLFVRLLGAPAENDPSVRHPPNPRYGTPEQGITVHIPQHRNKGVMQLPEAASVSDPSVGKLMTFDDRHLHYLASTEPGCSGSPILDHEWRLIGVHTNGDLPNCPNLLRQKHNRGTRIDSILENARRRGFDVDQVPYLLAQRNVVRPGNWI